MIGAKLGKWTLDKELGRGGMGKVYLAHGDSADDRAALKVLSAELAQEAGFLQRFQREIEVLGQLSHPNIVRFLEAGTQDGLFYYAMEYVPGDNFEQLLSAEALRKTGYFDPAAVRHWRAALLHMRHGSYPRTAVEMGLMGVTATQLWHQTFIDPTLAEVPAEKAHGLQTLGLAMGGAA